MNMWQRFKAWRNRCSHCWHFNGSEDHTFAPVAPCELAISNYSDKYTCCHCHEVKWVKDGGGW